MDFWWLSVNVQQWMTNVRSWGVGGMLIMEKLGAIMSGGGEYMRNICTFFCCEPRTSLQYKAHWNNFANIRTCSYIHILHLKFIFNWLYKRKNEKHLSPSLRMFTWSFLTLQNPYAKGDFLGGPVVKKPLCKAVDMGSIPGWGTKISHISEKLKPVHHN